MKKITIFTLCITLFIIGSMSAQKTVWVAAVAAGAANGTSEADAYGSFATALADITAGGDVLRVVGIVPAGSQSLNVKNFQYTIEGDATGSTLTGTGGLTRMFTINDPTAAGQDVTFRNIKFTGSTNFSAGGGAVLLSNQPGVSITFENCRFQGNSLASTVTTGGGALSIANSSVTITDCLFKENQALRNGGAIFITNANVNITGSTFYKNSTTDTTSSFGAAALYVNGTAVVTVDHCTFFQNNIGHPNQDYGTIRTEAAAGTSVCTTITNSLFYDNKVKNLETGELAGAADWGSSPNGIQTFSKSIGQWITSNIDFRTNFISFVKGSTDPLIVAANLTSSNLTYDDALGKVTYNAPTVAGENSPIGFVAVGDDAGAWQSGLTLSVKDNAIAADFSVSYNAQTKNLRVIRSNDDSVSLEIYNLMGSKVLSRTSANKEENISSGSLQTGVYILVAKGSENKTFAKKFIIN